MRVVRVSLVVVPRLAVERSGLARIGAAGHGLPSLPGHRQQTRTHWPAQLPSLTVWSGSVATSMGVLFKGLLCKCPMDYKHRGATSRGLTKHVHWSLMVVQLSARTVAGKSAACYRPYTRVRVGCNGSRMAAATGPG
jgi:hypothetical protein